MKTKKVTKEQLIELFDYTDFDTELVVDEMDDDLNSIIIQEDNVILINNYHEYEWHGISFDEIEKYFN